MGKINIAELLKDCPKGMELDCTMFDNVTFEGLYPDGYPIKIKVKSDGRCLYLTENGCWNKSDNAKCVIFPKGKTTWEGFQRPFEDGDIVATEHGVFIGIVKAKNNGSYETYCAINGVGSLSINTSYCFERLATEEEKQKLFDAIKANGYKWNEETKILEKLTESKEDVDDEILMSGIYFDRKYYAYEVELHLDNYEIEIRDGRTYAVVKNQKTKTLEPKFKVGDRIRTKKDAPINMSNILITKVNECSYEGVIGYTTNLAHISFKYQDLYELAPHKFDINTLKPFDKVLVRSNSGKKWTIDFFGVIDNYNKYPFTCLGHSVTQCIPYEGNQHLLDTTDDCDEFYKN